MDCPVDANFPPPFKPFTTVAPVAPLPFTSWFDTTVLPYLTQSDGLDFITIWIDDLMEDKDIFDSVPAPMPVPTIGAIIFPNMIPAASAE